MTETDINIADLIGSRICHDLINPISAISNGVELLALGRAGPELELIGESVENATARIRFFRIAFGAASADQDIAGKEVAEILAAVAQSGRLAIDLQAEDSLPRAHVKLAFLLIMCLETAMPWGGHVAITSMGRQWALTGTADQLKLDRALWDLLFANRTDMALEPGQVQFALAPAAARQIGRGLLVENSDTRIRIRF